MPFTKVDHKFTHPELNYDSTPNFQPCIKVSVFFRKLDSIDHDTFFGHWQTVHADLAVATQAFRKHIVRYSQHHQTVEMKQRAESLGENVLDYDGCAQLWVRSWDDWLAFYNSKEYAAALSDDCDRFMTLPMTYMVGYENLVVGEGSRKMGGTDGIDISSL
ncbi:EthD domain-containing protein [Ilyonectria robusta]|uniref:EthD domain-containing protein n=1 Tax=Ilyonectria robusta TaxID=1079257 RepID=UPI001E8DF2F3|nr:EthD domain-containing protein [Ilyonectria robusta]KAH8685063.1 EthD domain-containing protein [Ilyonectria robusta]